MIGYWLREELKPDIVDYAQRHCTCGDCDIRLENERVIVDFTNEDRAHLFPSLASRTSKMPTRPSLGCARSRQPTT